MAIKYRIQYNDITGITHRCDISKDDYVGNITNVGGRVWLDYANTDNLLEVVRGQGLRIELEANQDLDFSDLYTDVERTYSVTYTRGNEILFQGFLNPEGLYQSLVDENWIVSLDAIDGISYLDNLSFVDSDGVPFTGKQTDLEIIVNALRRTNISKSIATNVRIVYDGLNINSNVLDNVYSITDRFQKEDDETIMSCKEVLMSVLRKYSAILISTGEEYVIYRPGDMARSDNWTFFLYNSEGASTGTEVRTYYQQIGSKTQGNSVFYVNGNQQINYTASLGGYRVNYKFGLREGILTNPNFFSSDGVTLNGWSVRDNTYLTLGNPGYGLTFSTNTNNTIVTAVESDVVQVDEGIAIQLELDMEVDDFGISAVGSVIEIVVFASAVNTLNSYYLNNNGEWNGDSAEYIKVYSGINFNLTLLSQPLPEDCDVYVAVRNPKTYGANSGVGVTIDTIVNSVDIRVADDSGKPLEGEFHTGTREGKGTKTDNVDEVYTGDNPLSDVYMGTLYESDQTTNTQDWTRIGFSETKPILQIMVEERLRLEQLPARNLQGDIYGYLPYESIISIDNYVGRHQFLEYSYNTRENITTMKVRQMYSDELTDIEYSKTNDYGKVVRPTIKS